MLQEMAQEGHLQIETSDTRATLRLTGSFTGPARVQESLSLFESVSQMKTATATDTNSGIKTALINSIGAVAAKSNLSIGVRAQKIKKLMKLIDDLDSDKSVQEDDDADVEEDMPTPGENGPLAESYRGSGRPYRSGRALAENCRGPRTAGVSVLSALGRDDAATDLLESMGRGDRARISVMESLGRRASNRRNSILARLGR
jgi:hypothetical protein